MHKYDKNWAVWKRTYNMYQRGYIKDQKDIKEKVHYYTTMCAAQKTLKHEYWEILQNKNFVQLNLKYVD